MDNLNFSPLFGIFEMNSVFKNLLIFTWCSFIITLPFDLMAMRTRNRSYIKQLRSEEMGYSKKDISRKQFFEKLEWQMHELPKRHRVQKEPAQEFRGLWGPQFAAKNPLLATMLMLYLFVAQVNTQRQHGNSPIIYSKPYRPGQELKTFGPCEPWSNNKSFCCDIKPGYTVECCVHPNTLGYSQCVTFDPVGILGDSSVTSYDNAVEDYRKVEKGCKRRYTMAKEARAMLKPVKLQNQNGTSCSVERIERDDKHGAHLDLVVSSGLRHCMVHFSDISYTPLLPLFRRAVNDLARRLNIKHKLHIWVYDDDECGKLFYLPPMHWTLKKDGSSGLMLPYSFLKKFSDMNQMAILGHELHHEKQVMHGEKNLPKQLSELTGNGIESEADISATLNTKSTCLSVALVVFSRVPRRLLLPFFPNVTRGSLRNLFDGSDSEFHAPYSHRVPLILGIAKNLQLARRLLRQKK